MNKKVLLGSPIYRNPTILKEFLISIAEISQDDIDLSYIFVDDNIDTKSSNLLEQFKDNCKNNVTIIKGLKDAKFLCDENTHYWSNNLIWKVAEYKNMMIRTAIDKGFDYLFFIDSDIIVHPNILKHLISTKKDIISEIFWTKFNKDSILLPNVWLYDKYDMVERKAGEQLTKEESIKRFKSFINKLKKPGIYEVGGLGACTLLSQDALIKGVNFSEIKNLTLPGEDRHFCVRAAALGIPLYVDTHFPALHIYRDEELKNVHAFKANFKNQSSKKSTYVRYMKEKDNKVTLSMVIKNERGRYLEEVLNEVCGIIDSAVIIDDASTDNCSDICLQYLKDIPVTIIRNETSNFHNEINLRKQQWLETIKTNPDWILSLDADEVFEPNFKNSIKKLINQTMIDVYYFKLFDMWDRTHYRQDNYWAPSFMPFLIRYQKNFPYRWKETAQHCGRFPINISLQPKAFAPYRIKHMGWSTKKDREAKFRRYKELDPNAEYGIKEQYNSILDDNPNLIEWQDDFKGGI